jgi:hypothetical protein
MSYQLRREYLTLIQDRYKNSTHNQKTLILDEFCAVCGYSRKYAIAVLNGKKDPCVRLPRGRTVKYTETVVHHAVRLWRAMGEPGSTKLKAALPEWIDYDDHPDVLADDVLRSKLLEISRAQLDRILRNYRNEDGISTTRHGCKRFMNQIPIQVKDWNAKSPGERTQGDTVAHCGNSLLGSFANSITVTDLYSTWTENRAMWTKGSARVIEAMRDIEANLPFILRGHQTDSGSEYMNYGLLAYFTENRSDVVQFTRSRPYKKNDNCYVEQKNFTHVRELFGYERIDDESLVDLMNEIYTKYWGPLQNFFMPSQKLLRKTRIGGFIKKEYEPAMTPYRRLMSSDDLTNEQKEALAKRKQEFNPFDLQKKLKKRLVEFDELVRKRNTRRWSA